MPKLHIAEYARFLKGSAVHIACRQGIIWDHFEHIIKDVRFLNRQGVLTTLFHNLPDRFANQKHLRKLSARLPESNFVRVPADADFYDHVLDYPQTASKLILIERRYLVDRKGHKINAMTTAAMRSAMKRVADVVDNRNLMQALDLICSRIEAGQYERVHVLPAGKNTIKHELFTVEGTGTLIANNFSETFKTAESADEMDMILSILNQYKREGYLKPRKRQYIWAHRDNFYVTKIDGIIVGCIEKKIIDTKTVELGALAISTKFRNQRVGIYTVKSFINTMTRKGFHRFIALTNNPRLETLLEQLGFGINQRPEYAARQKESPGVKMYYKEI